MDELPKGSIWIEVRDIPRGIDKKNTLLLPNHKFIRREKAKELLEKGKIQLVKEDN